MEIRRRALAALCLSVLVVVVAPGLAGAHAAYKGSDPADDSTVSSPPSSVWAEYTEPPAPSSYMRVFDPCGRQVDHGDSRATGYRLTVSMSAGTAGTYRVDWAVLSAFDGHPTSGRFTFTSAGGEPCPGAREEGDTGGGNEPEGGGREPSGGTGGDKDAPSGPSGAAAADRSRAGERPRRDNARDDDARKSPRRRARPEPEDDPVPDLAAAPDPAGTPEERKPPADIPLDGLVVGLGLAAAIGAAGGFVYAGIMGPKR